MCVTTIVVGIRIWILKVVYCLGSHGNVSLVIECVLPYCSRDISLGTLA